MQHVDLTGLQCPHVVLGLARAMRGLAIGARVRAIASDPLSRIDIPVFLHRKGHVLLSQDREEGSFVFVIQAGGDVDEAGSPES